MFYFLFLLLNIHCQQRVNITRISPSVETTSSFVDAVRNSSKKYPKGQYSDFIDSYSNQYAYNSEGASKIVNMLSQSYFTVAGESCGLPPMQFNGRCFGCVGNSFDSLGLWTDAMDGPDRNAAKSVAQVGFNDALKAGFLDITAKFPSCGPNSHPLNPAPPPGSVIVYDHGTYGHITVMKNNTVACADNCTPLEDTLAGSFTCLKVFMLVKKI